MRKEKRQPKELFGARTDLGLAASECGKWAAGQSGDTKLKDEKSMKTQQSVFLKRFGKKQEFENKSSVEALRKNIVF